MYTIIYFYYLCIGSFYSCFSETGFHYVALASLELTVYTWLSLNLQRLACLCLCLCLASWVLELKTFNATVQPETLKYKVK